MIFQYVTQVTVDVKKIGPTMRLRDTPLRGALHSNFLGVKTLSSKCVRCKIEIACINVVCSMKPGFFTNEHPI